MCVNSDNSVNVDLLSAFGIDTYKKDANGNIEKDESGKPVKMDTASIPYEYFIGQTFKLVDNDSYYVYDEETGKYETMSESAKRNPTVPKDRADSTR